MKSDPQSSDFHRLRNSLSNNGHRVALDVTSPDHPFMLPKNSYVEKCDRTLSSPCENVNSPCENVNSPCENVNSPCENVNNTCQCGINSNSVHQLGRENCRKSFHQCGIDNNRNNSYSNTSPFLCKKLNYKSVGCQCSECRGEVEVHKHCVSGRRNFLEEDNLCSKELYSCDISDFQYPKKELYPTNPGFSSYRQNYLRNKDHLSLTPNRRFFMNPSEMRYRTSEEYDNGIQLNQNCCHSSNAVTCSCTSATASRCNRTIENCSSRCGYAFHNSSPLLNEDRKCTSPKLNHKNSPYISHDNICNRKSVDNNSPIFTTGSSLSQPYVSPTYQTYFRRAGERNMPDCVGAKNSTDEIRREVKDRISFSPRIRENNFDTEQDGDRCGAFSKSIDKSLQDDLLRKKCPNFNERVVQHHTDCKSCISKKYYDLHGEISDYPEIKYSGSGKGELSAEKSTAGKKRESSISNASSDSFVTCPSEEDDSSLKAAVNDKKCIQVGRTNRNYSGTQPNSGNCVHKLDSLDTDMFENKFHNLQVNSNKSITNKMENLTSHSKIPTKEEALVSDTLNSQSFKSRQLSQFLDDVEKSLLNNPKVKQISDLSLSSSSDQSQSRVTHKRQQKGSCNPTSTTHKRQQKGSCNLTSTTHERQQKGSCNLTSTNSVDKSSRSNSSEKKDNLKPDNVKTGYEKSCDRKLIESSRWRPPVLSNIPDINDLVTSEESFISDICRPQVKKIQSKSLKKCFDSYMDGCSFSTECVEEAKCDLDLPWLTEPTLKESQTKGIKKKNVNSNHDVIKISDNIGKIKFSDRTSSEVLPSTNSSFLNDGFVDRRSSWDSYYSDISTVDYVYTDTEEGVVLIERWVPSVSDNNSKRSSVDSIISISTSDSQSTVQYDWRTYATSDSESIDTPKASENDIPQEFSSMSNEEVRSQLVLFGDDPGPIVPSTRQTFLRRLTKLSQDPDTPKLQLTTKPEYSIELQRSLRGDDIGLGDSQSQETAMEEVFQNPLKNRKWREGGLKSSFNYLLMDPRVTKNLPLRTNSLELTVCSGKKLQKVTWEDKLINKRALETFKVFIAAIFYVGKGKRARPYCHLYEALASKENKKNKEPSAKVKQILDIWDEGLGVVSLHCFQNVIPVEAYTREACMVDAIGLGMLTNKKRGDYYGISTTWSAKDKRKLGVYLLKKALQIFLAEGERQICPPDIKIGQ